jgi:hypothetical protein
MSYAELQFCQIRKNDEARRIPPRCQNATRTLSRSGSIRAQLNAGKQVKRIAAVMPQ